MADKIVLLREIAATATMLMRSRASAPAAAVRSDYDVEIISDPGILRERLKAVFPDSASSLFQRAGWLACWYATVGADQGAVPLLVQIYDRILGTHVMTLPLVMTRTGNLRTIEFADLGVTDYNAPILGPAAPSTETDAAAVWQHVLQALPGCDLIHLRKMPLAIGGRPNPLVLLRDVSPSSCPGFSISMPDDWETYMRSLAKKFRKELGRSLRLFEAEADTRFCRINDVEQAARVLKVMSEQQRSRLAEMGYDYAFDERSYNRFYASLVAGGLEAGTTLLTALMAGDEVVAALLGTSDGTSFAMVRLSHAGGDWLRVGVGRLIIERTMHELHAQGCRHFDFTIGDYPYKSGFGVEPSPLCDLVTGRSWRGKGIAAGDLAKAGVKRALGTMGISVVPKAVKERYRRYRASN